MSLRKKHSLKRSATATSANNAQMHDSSPEITTDASVDDTFSDEDSVAPPAAPTRPESQKRPRSSNDRKLEETPTWLQSQMKEVQKQRDRALSSGERLDIVMATLSVKHEAAVLKQKHPDRAKPAQARPRVVKLLGRSAKVVQSAWNEWLSSQRVEARSAPANRKAKATRIPSTKHVVNMVREFVRDERAALRVVTARRVAEFLKEKGILVGLSKFQSDIRNVQRFLRRHGFKRGKKKGEQGWAEKETTLKARGEYLRVLLSNREAPVHERLREVYLDESYLHHHRHHFTRSYFDPADEKDKSQRLSGKGRRYCFIAAIMGENPRVRIVSDPKDKPRLILESFDMFQSQLPSKVDYHRNFNASRFQQWLKEKLLPNLHEPSLIILDNAAYHKTMASDTPVPSKMKKAELQHALQEKKIDFARRDTVPVLRSKLDDWVAKNCKMEVERLCEEQGHRVLFTPPYHSDLQPIELCWAFTKGQVADKYEKGTTMKQAGDRLTEAFVFVAGDGADMVRKWIQHCFAVAVEFWEADSGEKYQPLVAGLVSDTNTLRSSAPNSLAPNDDEESDVDSDFDSTPPSSDNEQEDDAT